MNVLARINLFVNYLNDKKKIVSINLLRSNRKLSELKSMIDNVYGDIESLEQQMRDVFSTGVINRGDIYKNIRRQGVLLCQIESLGQELFRLNEMLDFESEINTQHNVALLKLNKRSFMINEYCTQSMKVHYRKSDSKNENEIEELSIYGKQNW